MHHPLIADISVVYRDLFVFSLANHQPALALPKRNYHQHTYNISHKIRRDYFKSLLFKSKDYRHGYQFVKEFIISARKIFLRCKVVAWEVIAIGDIRTICMSLIGDMTGDDETGLCGSEGELASGYFRGRPGPRRWKPPLMLIDIGAEDGMPCRIGEFLQR